MNQVVENFNKIIIKLPQLISILSELNSTGIKYGLYAGSHVAILTSNPSFVGITYSTSLSSRLKALIITLAGTGAIALILNIWLGTKSGKKWLQSL